MGNYSKDVITIFDQSLVSAVTPQALIYKGGFIWNKITETWDAGASTTPGVSHYFTGTTVPAVNTHGVNFIVSGILGGSTPNMICDLVYLDGTTYVGGVKIIINEDGVSVIPE